MMCLCALLSATSLILCFHLLFVVLDSCVLSVIFSHHMICVFISLYVVCIELLPTHLYCQSLNHFCADEDVYIFVQALNRYLFMN